MRSPSLGYMAWTVPVLTLAAITTRPAFSQSSTGPASASEIHTSATASRSLPADLAVLTLEFTGRGRTLTEAARDAAVRSRLVRQALAAAGVPEDSLFSRGTVGYYWDERTQTEIRPHPSGYGRMDTVYAFRDVIIARVRDMKRVGAVIDTAIAAGAHRLTSMHFSATRTQAASLEALTEATQVARRQAELMAKAAGGKLGRLVQMSTQPIGRGENSYEITTMTSSHASENPRLTVKPAHVELKVSVVARWEFLPGP